MSSYVLSGSMEMFDDCDKTSNLDCKLCLSWDDTYDSISISSLFSKSNGGRPSKRICLEGLFQALQHCYSFFASALTGWGLDKPGQSTPSGMADFWSPCKISEDH